MASVEELERAASVLMAPPMAVSKDERLNAEQLFLSFRKTRNPYEMCKKILQSSKEDYVLFEAATTIKEAIIREWSLLKKQEIDSICSFLLCCVTERPNLQKYVCEQFLLVIAVIFKRGTLDDAEAISKLVAGLKQLVSTGDKSMELVACSIMKALLTEYSTTTQSTNFGRSLDFHVKCKKAFEEKDLLHIFMLTIQMLQKYMSVSITSLSRQDMATFVRYLSLAEQIFHWEFSCNNPLSLLNFPGSFESNLKIKFRPHLNWKEVLMNPNMLDLFFHLLRAVLTHEELSHLTMQSLTQIASVSGPVFEDEDDMIKFIGHYITCLLSVVNVHRWTEHQALGLSNIIFRLCDVSPVKVLASLQQQLLTTFLDAIAFLTSTFLEASVNVKRGDIDDNEYLEAANIMLDSWVILVEHVEDFPSYFPPLLKEHCAKIVSVYVSTHLAPPSGIRQPGWDSEDVELDMVETDREACADELSNIGHLCRQCLAQILPALSQRLDERVGILRQLYENIVAHGGNTNNVPLNDELFEDIHWLVLVSAFVLTTETSGESSQLPMEIVDYSNQFLSSHREAVTSSVCYLTSMGKSSAEHADQVVVLITTVFKAIHIEIEFLKAKLNSCFSPEVSSSLLWFLKRFTKCYLTSLTNVKLSPTLSACFDFKQECGKFVVKSMLEITEVNLSCWASEPQVSGDAVKLLLRMLGEKARVSVCLSYDTVWNISKKFSLQSQDIRALSPEVHRHLVHSLIRACTQIQNTEMQEQFQQQLVKPIMSQYQEVRSRENFQKTMHCESVTKVLVRTFECIRGMTPAFFGNNANILYEYFTPIFEDSINLLKIYENSKEMIVIILEMFADVVESILVVLNKQNSSSFCKICVKMMENYSRYNLGKKVIDGLAEEEQYYDLLLLIQLLTHILSKDYLDFSDEPSNDSGQSCVESVCPVDVVLFGLHLVIPLINEELMKYPRLSNEYFKLVTFVCEVYPERMKDLPEDLFQNFMASIQMAISNYATDTTKCALDALSSLAKYYFGECERSALSTQQLNAALLHFLNIVFQYMVLEQFNMDLIEPASESLFLLICCHQEEYLKLANNLIAQQHVTDENFKNKLIKAFEVLTPSSLQLTPNRKSLKEFRKNIEIFLQDVKGFLCIK